MRIRPLQYCTLGTKPMLVKVLVLTLCLMPIFTAQRVIAHHSMDRFDAKNVTTVEGLVKKVEWGNPHVYIYIDQLSDNGNLIEWEVEGFPPAIMRRLGWSRDTLRVKDAIAITGNQHKNAEIKSIYPTSIKRADSSLLNMLAMMMTINKVGEEPEFGTKSIEGIWVTLLSLELIQQYADPKKFDLTEAGLAAVENFNENTMHPGLNCIPGSPPSSMTIPDTKKITIVGDTINIINDFDNADRTIHLNQNDHRKAVPSIQGHSIGHWQGKTLVVDTTHFSNHAMGLAWGLPSGSKKHLVERITLSDDGKSIMYESEMTDPDFINGALTAKVQWVYRPTLEYTTEECDLDNARRFLIN